MNLKVRLRWFAVACLAALAFAATALAAGSSLKVHAPKSVKLTKHYTVKVSGKASGHANFVVGWEVAGHKCKSNYAAEYHFLANPTSAPVSQSVTGPFSFTAGFTAAHTGKAYFCAYLINQTTTHTYKHAFKHWKEHK